MRNLLHFFLKLEVILFQNVNDFGVKLKEKIKLKNWWILELILSVLSFSSQIKVFLCKHSVMLEKVEKIYFIFL